MSAPATSRRAMLAGGGALPVASGAQAGNHPHPDAALLAACQALPGLRAAVDAATYDIDEETPLGRAYFGALDVISRVDAQTFEGWLAKAEAVRAESLDSSGAENPHSTMGATWAWQLVANMRALVASGVVR